MPRNPSATDIMQAASEVGVVAARGTFDALISEVPGLGLAWSVANAFLEAPIKLRQKRALEYIEYIRDNPDDFSLELLQNEKFQDGFVYLLEKYLRERRDDHRRVMRNILSGFAAASTSDEFPVEKYLHTLSQLSEKDVEVFRDVDLNRQDDRNYQIYGNTITNLSGIFNLINLGVLHEATGSRLGPVLAPFVTVSDFGRGFRKFINT